jgi:uncharacterized damage-inducible protein DinB
MNFFDELYDRFRELHADIKKSIENIPEAALDWSPGPEMNSIAVLVVHLAGAERYWVGVALNEAPARDREAEFKARGLRAVDLKAEIDSADDYAHASLARLSLADLEVVHLSPRNGKSFTTGWCLAHALEHTALHSGHIQLTRQLWDQKGSA